MMIIRIHPNRICVLLHTWSLSLFLSLLLHGSLYCTPGERERD